MEDGRTPQQRFHPDIGCFSLFLIHLIIEGYIYAAGSYLCYLFWLIFGNGLSLAHKKVAMTRKRL